jgi:thiol-disulfide isomerase/thioredoxin
MQAVWFSITPQKSITISLAVLSLFPAMICGQSPTEKRILEELQKLNQRLEKIEKKLEEKPPLVSSHNDPEKKIFGMQFARGPKGNRVMAVMQGSPADKAGVRPGELLAAIDGNRVTALSGAELLRELEKKDSYVFNFERKNGEKRQVTITKSRQGDFTDERGGYILAGEQRSLSEVDVGQAAPEITAKDVDGKDVKLSSLKGKVVLVNFTATWCGPCKKELPDLIGLHQKYHAQGFEVISVFLDSDSTAVERYLKENAISWLYAFDGKGWDNQVAREWGISGVPTNAIIDKAGVVVETNVRGSKIEPAVAKYLK